MAVTAVIAAAGSGERLGAGGPKAFVPLAGRPMVEWSIEAFREAASVRSIVVACPPGHVHDLAGGDLAVVEGGATRAESVSHALEVVGTELVAIHDAARPLVTPELIEETIATLVADADAAGAIAATPVTDTIKQVEEQGSTNSGRLMHLGPHGGPNASVAIESTLDRWRLWAAQTPQVFRTEALRDALAAWSERAGAGSGEAGAEGPAPEATDEAMLVGAAGGRVLIHPSPPENLKVTTPLDLRLAELLLAER